MLPKKKACVKSFDGQTKWMYFLIENDDLLKKYNTILDKVSTDIKNECKYIQKNVISHTIEDPRISSDEPNEA